MNEGVEKTNEYDARFAESLGGSEYDDLLIAIDYYDEFQSQTGKALQEYIAKHCADQTEIKVLEAGPGTGITTFKLLKSDPRVVVVSVDNEPKMLQAVRERFDQAQELKDRVEFVEADILAFLESCEDETFDAFASVYTLHNFTPDFRTKVIELIARKLKKGGVFINGDKYAREEDSHQQDYAAEARNYGKFDEAADEAERSGKQERAAHLRKIHEEWLKHMAEDEKNKITVEEQNALFERLGFIDVEWGKRFDLVTTVTAIKAAS
ncbi:MAG: hypothetical protein RLY47_487 [Candidatus Parcubacteria bacterium]|jgi:ubiquinone/menaquinone biosynthesis C-methylase UbiE